MYKHMANVMFVLATLILIYCPISLYNLPTLTAGGFVCLALHQLYEWGCRRFRRGSEPSLVTASDTTLATEDSEEDQSKPAIKDSPDSDDETPTDSDASRKNSRTSEISMSSYDAVSLTELKNIERGKEVEEESEEEENEEEENDEDENDEEENEGDEEEKEDDNYAESEKDESDKEREIKEESEREQIVEQKDENEHVTEEQKEELPKEQIKDTKHDAKDLPKLKRKQRKEESKDLD